MKRARYPTVELLWLDSVQLEGGDWMHVDEARSRADDLRQRSVGLLIAETELAVVLARSISEWEDATEKAEGVLVIPKLCIVERR